MSVAELEAPTESVMSTPLASIRVAGSQLTSAIAVAMKALSKWSRIPILANVLLESDGTQTLRATVTDLDTTVTVHIPIVSEGDRFATSVDCRALHSFVKSEKGDVAIEHYPGDDKNPSRLSLRSSTASTSFPTLPSEEYPSGIRREEHFTTAVANYIADFAAAQEAIVSASTIASREEACGAVLMGTYLDFETPRIAATDGYVAFLDDSPFKLTSDVVAPNAIVTQSAIGAIKAIKLPKGARANLSVQATAQYARFAANVGGVSYLIVTRLVDGQYPSIDGVIPKAPATTLWDVDRRAFVDAVKRAGAIAGDRAQMTKLSFNPGTPSGFTVSASSEISGESSTAVPATPLCGTAVEIYFSAKTLLRALAIFNDERVTVGFTPSVAGSITSPSGSRRAIVMPLRK